MLSHGHLVPMFLYFQVFKFDFNPLLFPPWESQNLIWSRLSFQTFSKMQGTIPKEKKCRLAFTLSSVLLAASITTVAELLRTLCAALVVVLLRENSFCGGISMLELTLTNGSWQWEYNLILKNKLLSSFGCFVLP